MAILMGHFAYAEILLAIFVPVAIISFITPISRYRRYGPLLISIAIVDPFYIIWDQLAVIYGTWSFNSAEVTGIYFFHLPIEEVAFFLVVPFSTILIYEAVNSHIHGKFKEGTTSAIAMVFFSILIIFGIFNINRSYTSVASFFAAGSIAIGTALDRTLMSSKSLWIYMAVSYIPFVFFDHLMVTLPVFTYGINAIIGIRILSIPLEEFEYVFSLLLLYVIFYDLSARWISGRLKALK
jgi:lycopene cyclase domain-containing protein